MTDTRTWDRMHGEHLELLVASVRLRIERRARWLRAERWASDPLEELSAALVTDERADRLLTGDDRKQAAAFAAEDEASVRLSAAIDDVAGELTALASSLTEHGAPPRIDRLTAVADLAPVERDGVVVALAAALDPGIGALLGYVQDDPALAHATPAVVAALFDHPLHLAWQLLAPSGRLRAARLAVATPASGQPARIALAPRTLAWLAGDDRADPALRGVLCPPPPALLAASHRRVAERVSAALDDGLAVQLVGGGGPVAAAVAATRGEALLTVDAAVLVAHPDRHQLLDAIVREALLTPALVLVEVDGPLGEDEHELARLVDAATWPVVVATGSRLPTRSDVLVAELPAVTAADRERLWREAAGEAAPTGEALTRLVDTFRLDPTGIAAASADARRHDHSSTTAPRSRPDGTSRGRTQGAHWAAAKATVSRAVGGLAERVVPAQDPADLVVPGTALAALDELVAQTRHQRRVFDEWGMGRLLPHGRGATALFAGPSGTGKTMAAEIVAGRLGLDLYRVDLSAVVSKYIGETEKNLRRVFDAVESGAAVLLFDEADALFGRRTEVSDAHDRHANVEVSYLLQRMEQYAGIAVLTTNRKADIDEAFLRRLRVVLTFPFPDRTARRLIWERMLATDAPLGELDLDALARLEITGGNIRSIVLAAAFAAADAGGPLAMDHLMAAARREYGKLDKVVTPSEFGPWSAVAS